MPPSPQLKQKASTIIINTTESNYFSCYDTMTGALFNSIPNLPFLIIIKIWIPLQLPLFLVINYKTKLYYGRIQAIMLRRG